jgi:alkanesulfonate monooxygenase SsuD/methylene tetrahydromethanopterin reductase-like flavin-dependent oxidoreductase (luciferase family)
MIEGQEGVTWSQWTTIARAAEDAGFGALFTSDHYGSAYDRPGRDALDVWGVICALAAVTERIRLGTLVSPVTFRHPSVLAKLVMTADRISGGRVELGLGAGWHEREHAAFGLPFASLGERLDLLGEQATVIRRLLAGERFDHDGPAYRYGGAQLLPRTVQERLPILLGGGALPRVARLAALHADEYNVVWMSPDEARAARGRLDRACEAVERDPATLPMSLMTRCVVGIDEADYRRRLERVCTIAGEDPTAAEAEDGAGWIAGTIEQARARIAAYQDAGVTRFFLQHLDHGDVDAVAMLGAALVPMIEEPR